MTNNSDEFNTLREEEVKSININEIISTYVYHWPVFVLSVFISLLVASVYLRYAQPIYVVSSTLLIKNDKKGGMSNGGDLLNDINMFGTSKEVENEIEIIKSRSLMREVVDRLNLSVNYKTQGRVKTADLYSNRPVNFHIISLKPSSYGRVFELKFIKSNTYQLIDKVSGITIKGELNNIERTSLGEFRIDADSIFNSAQAPSLILTINDPASVVNQYLSQLEVSQTSKQSAVLDIKIKETVPERGQDILKTLVKVYNEAALEDKNRTTQSTIQFINERLRLITDELTGVEKNVEGFKSSRGLTDISNDANLFLENVKSNDSKLGEINLQISVVKDILRYVNSSSLQEKIPSTLGINDPVLLTQINRLSDLQLQRDQLLATTTENNPIVTPLFKQIETTKDAIKSSLKNILTTLIISKSDLEGNNSQFKGSIKKIPGQERELISIKRQQSIKESLYLYLLQKKEEAELSFASSVADSRIVDPAYSTYIPISPKRQMIYLLGLLAGFGLPVFYIYFKHLVYNKISGSDDIIKLTSASILGEILLSEDNEQIVVTPGRRTAIAEQFRSIRTNMQFLHGKKGSNNGHVTLFTSSMSGEGKSFVACNVAAALASAGKKTVLLELDLRKPKVSKYLDLENKIGLSNYFIGDALVGDIIVPSKVNDNFFVIPSGPIPPNPSELLVQEEVEALVSELTKNFDEVLIDTPPIGLVTDAQILSRLADATIYLVRQNVTFKQQIENLDKLYKSRKFPRMNIILNGVKIRRNSNYGYGYGYYSDDLKSTGFTLSNLVKDFFRRF